MASYWAMDGYAFYVWSSYALSAFGLGGLAVASLVSLKRREKRLADLRAALAQEASSEEPTP